MDELENNNTPEEMSFEQVLNSMPDLQLGQLVKGQILKIVDEGVLVNMGLKSEGLIPMEEFQSTGIPKELTPGTEISVVLCKTVRDGGYILSYQQARRRSVWKTLELSHQQNKPVTAHILKKIKGGFIVDIGIDAFMPASQLELKSDKIVNKEINIIITELSDKNVVVSNRKYIEQEKEVIQKNIFSKLKQDDIVEGTVTDITDFGAFIDIGGIDALVHISDLAWYRISKVQDVLKKGQKIKAKVIKIDPKEKKISLGLKQLTPHPWDNIEQKYPVGKQVKGKVISTTEFGVFVELEPGLEGLLHISELSWRNDIKHPKELIKKNETLDLKIISLDKNKEKLSLSLKHLLPNPWETLKNKYSPGSKVKGKVTKIVSFGAFISLEEGLEGLLHIDDISWVKKIKHPNEVLHTGQEIEVVLLDIKPKEEKAALSLKHITENPYKKYSLGKVVKGTVERISDFGAFVRLEDDIEAFVHKSEISFLRDKAPSELLKTGQEIEAKVIRSDKENRKIDLSIKKLDKDREKELVKKYSQKKAPTLSDILQESS